MPVDFLTDEQERRYGRYAGELPPVELARSFYLDDADRALISGHRGDHNRLGLALQLTTVRFLGTFLIDPAAVPVGVVAHVAAQLGIADPTCLDRYRVGETRWDHADEIKRIYGYRDFGDQPEHVRLVRWLYARAWVSAERPSMLFDLATARLVEHKVLLPGVTTLARLVARVRDRVAERLWETLAAAPPDVQRARLERLVVVPTGQRVSPLEQLGRSPTRANAAGLLGALKRLGAFQALDIGGLDLTHVPASRITALARHAAGAWAGTIARMPPDRRVATLLAFARVYEARAQDDALDVLDQVIVALFARVEREGDRARLGALRALDVAALLLRDVARMVRDVEIRDAEVRATIEEAIGDAAIDHAIAVVDTLTRPPDDHYDDDLFTRYSTMRQFLPTLLRTVAFAGTAAARPVLDAVAYLREIEGQKAPDMLEAPLDVVPPAWRRLVVQTAPTYRVDRKAYTFALLEQLQAALKRHDVFVTPSEKWADPRATLLQGAAWEAARPQVCRGLGHTTDATAEVDTLARHLDARYHRTAANLARNPFVRVEQEKGRDTVVISPLEKLDEPASLLKLRDGVQTRLPRVDLSDVILEVQTWTGFTDAFTHISEGNARVHDLTTSICAVLLAEACNIGLEPLIRPDVPALTRGRLEWVQQNYIRAETIAPANAVLVDAQARILLAQTWGGGEVASADGLRFRVPVRTINAGASLPYFHFGVGVTYYNLSSDQFSGLRHIVVPGTLKDGPYLLAVLLEQDTQVQPTIVMSDSGAYSDQLFGLFWLLGYQFSPRLADAGDARLWRIDPKADYGALNGVARHRLNTTLITQHWDDLLRVAGSLRMGTVGAVELMRSLQGGNHQSALARAIGELGRIPKTLHLLAVYDDEAYRRRMVTQLNRGESWHSLARAVFHGRKGELRQRYREGQENQLGALGLVVNMLVLWTTRYMDVAVAQMRAQGLEVRDEDVARLSPLGYSHVNLLGRYHFSLPDAIARGELRPLRDPAAHDDDQPPAP